MADGAKTLDIVISTRTELKGAEQAADALEKQIGAAKAAGKNYDALQAQLDRARGAIAKFKNEHPEGGGEAWRGLNQELIKIFPALGKVEDVITKLGAGLIGGLAVAASAAAGALVGLKNGIAEYAAAEQAVSRLDAALAQNGLLTDEYRERLQELAGELSSVTAIADDDWLGVLRTLTQFGADESNITSAADAVKNLAGIMGGDLQSASMMVARALQGNFEMFSRYGIIVDQNASKQEKLKSVMEQLAQRGGGQLEAQAKTLSGQWANLKNQFSNFFEAIGGWIAQSGTLQRVINALANIAEYWAEKLGGVIPQVDGLTNAVRTGTGTMEDAEAAQKRYNQALEETERRAQAIVKAMQGEIEAIRQKKRLQDEEANAQMAAELAKVDYQEKLGAGRGGISASQAIRARFDIRQKYAEQDYQRDVAEKEKIKQAAQVALDKQKAEKARMEAEIKALEELLPVAAEYDQKQAEWNKWKQEQDTAQQEVTMLEKELDEQSGQFAFMGVNTAGGRSKLNIEADLVAARVRRENSSRMLDEAMDRAESVRDPGKSSAQVAADLAASRQRLDKFTETSQPEVQVRNKEISQANQEIASRTKVREAERMSAVYTAAAQAQTETDRQAKATIDAIKSGQGRTAQVLGEVATTLQQFRNEMDTIKKQVADARNP